MSTFLRSRVFISMHRTQKIYCLCVTTNDPAPTGDVIMINRMRKVLYFSSPRFVVVTSLLLYTLTTFWSTTAGWVLRNHVRRLFSTNTLQPTAQRHDLIMVPIRLRHPGGVSTLQLDFDSMTVQDLQQEVFTASQILPSEQECTFDPTYHALKLKSF